ncbi:EscU/YscU/HrcU family type III secretion system export apparatus switch protein [Parasedimentitalea maritima]|uniref:EscU/YscU/HrcU family type III secretion system export apparatus switch protein n=1 Tax=Parasedimentitalea maritima TaxID=2578117 RepID=A0A5R8ZF39_9RHOB|nr:TrgA family protein [Zongyanglinia marina]KAE9628603.1 TrgA family protein [Zongyanglinia marina]TLP64400.1 EscU/YscU/HrcU family type III secretion system export apparatus switch protein [Zongyanglinia marina]
MPTGARLTAALCLALLAFLLSGEIMPLMPEGTNFGYFTPLNMCLGLLVGWFVMGKRAGRGFVPALNNGISGVAVLLFWGLFIQGAYEMFRLAMRNRYGGPFEALSAIFTIGLDYAIVIFVPEVIVTVLIGAIVSGLATENASRRWR